jgi:hypothetical protein
MVHSSVNKIELLGVFSLADEGDKILRNVRKHSLKITASHSRRFEA